MNSGAECPVCGGAVGEPFLRRPGVPVLQNVLLPDARQARAVNRGDLVFAACGQCGFVYNRAFDPARIDYDQTYENTQTCSGTFKAHVEDLVRRLVDDGTVRGCHILEIGCGKGGFLTRLVEADDGNTGVGFDPSHLGPDRALDGRVRFVKDYFDPSRLDRDVDVVVCRHVIEHLPDPVGFLRQIRPAMGPRTRVYLETPCVEWILREQVIWDFFYEHCSLFTARSLALALRRAGIEPLACRHVFGGQYLWIEARGVCAPAGSCAADPAVAAMAVAFAAAEARALAAWQAVVTSNAPLGLGLWGAGAKGITLANLVDPRGESIDCVIDINPAKQGHYVAGTGHPIVAPDQIAGRGVRRVVAMNPLYTDEITQALDRLGSGIQLVEQPT